MSLFVISFNSSKNTGTPSKDKLAHLSLFTMIDCEIKFGSSVPLVPQIYKDAAKDDTSLVHNESGNRCTSNSSTYQNHLKRASECYIGPTWTGLKLLSVQPYNHDTSIFEFELPDPDAYLSLPVTAHLLVRAPETKSSQNESIAISSEEKKIDSVETKNKEIM